MDTPPAQPVNIADSITLTRAPGEQFFTLSVNGQVFPYAIDAAEGGRTKVGLFESPNVQVTLVARRVLVDDQRLVGVDLGHDHDDEGP